MTEAEFFSHFAALNAHLAEVRPIFDSFCDRHRFTYVNRTALGRYPRIRIKREGEVTIWFDLWMALDEDGRRFEAFRADIPYDLGCGADVVVRDGSKYGVRFGITTECFVNKPFNQVSSVLEAEMEKHLPALEQWDLQQLMKQGFRKELGR